MRLPLLATLLLTGCPTGDDATKLDDTGTTGPTTGCSGMDCFVFVNEPYVGDATCFDGTNWIEQTVGAGCTGSQPVNGTIEDFQSGNTVADANYTIWYSDDINSSPDVDAVGSADGTFTASVPACTPVAYKTFTPPDWEQTRDTYEVHQTYEYSPGGTSETFNSVSESTSRLIPALIGVTWDNTTSAVIAGTAYDCTETGIEKAQVYIRDAAGNAPVGTEANPFGVYYFKNDLPTDNASQPWTNADGLWVGVNVPAGDWFVDMYVWDDATSTHLLLGTTTLQLNAGAVYISNIYTGIDDGIYYPPSCLATCG